MDQGTRKLLTMHKALDLRDVVYRLYVSRKEGGIRLASIEDSFDASIKRLEDYIEERRGIQITATINNIDDDQHKVNNQKKWEEKQVYGRFKQLTINISHENLS